ncbi:MAG: hypothetical protein ACRCZB_06395 [Bacteroidales bacterium]
MQLQVSTEAKNIKSLTMGTFSPFKLLSLVTCPPYDTLLKQAQVQYKTIKTGCTYYKTHLQTCRDSLHNQQSLPATCRDSLHNQQSLPANLQGQFARPTKSSCNLQGQFAQPTKSSCNLQGQFAQPTKSSCNLQRQFAQPTRASCKLASAVCTHYKIFKKQSK